MQVESTNSILIIQKNVSALMQNPKHGIDLLLDSSLPNLLA